MQQKTIKGLQTTLCLTTGNVSLKYFYPISAKHAKHFTDMKIRNTQIISFTNRAKRNVTYVLLQLHGNSATVMQEFRLVQKFLMWRSRELKRNQLNIEIDSLY